jgi:hypothetical protein
MAEQIKIGCRLPAGYVLEVGLQVTAQANGRPITQVNRSDSYQRVYLKGTHSHTVDMRRKKIQIPSIGKPEPAYTMVDVAFWERWKKEHPRAGLLRNQDIFEVKDAKDTAAIQLDVMARKQILAPIDPNEIFRTDGNKVEKAVFEDDDKK